MVFAHVALCEILSYSFGEIKRSSDVVEYFHHVSRFMRTHVPTVEVLQLLKQISAARAQNLITCTHGRVYMYGCMLCERVCDFSHGCTKVEKG